LPIYSQKIRDLENYFTSSMKMLVHIQNEYVSSVGGGDLAQMLHPHMEFHWKWFGKSEDLGTISTEKKIITTGNRWYINSVLNICD
jgi:hypothetical protein